MELAYALARVKTWAEEAEYPHLARAARSLLAKAVAEGGYKFDVNSEKSRSAQTGPCQTLT